MVKVQRAASVALMLALDVLALSLTFFLVWHLRSGFTDFIVTIGQTFGYDTTDWVRRPARLPQYVPKLEIVMSRNPMVNIGSHLWVLYFSLLSWGALFYFQHGYDAGARRNSRQEFALCAYTGILATISLLAFMALLDLKTSRLFIAGLLVLGVFILWGTRVVVTPLAAKASKPRRNILLIGTAKSASSYAQMMAMPSYQWSRLVGYVADETTEAHDVPHLGKLADLPRVLDLHVVDEVLLVRAGQREGDVNWGEILELCLERGRTVSLVDDIAPPVGAKVEASMVGQMPVLVLHNTPQSPLALSVKSVMDRILAACALLILTPLFAVVGILIKKHDGGPILYTQDRVGLNGRLFRFYKFRSMDMNASEILEKMKRENRSYYDSINEMEEPFFKAREDNDPRITPVGRFIRKYSIDELPQFWNVLKGDMSLVGPRPPLPKEVAELAPWQRRKLSVKGGLTCIWQASGRNDITETDEWMRMDLEYIDNWSLWLDVKLLLKTVKSVVKGSGAG